MFTVGQRAEINHTKAWLTTHLLRADVAPNHMIAAKHDQLALKYLREMAGQFGYKLVPKDGT